MNGSDHLHPPFTATPIGVRLVWSGRGNTYIRGKFYAIGRPDPIEPLPNDDEIDAQIKGSFRRRPVYVYHRLADTRGLVVNVLRNLGRPSTVEEIARASGLSADTARRTSKSLTSSDVYLHAQHHNAGLRSMPALWALTEWTNA